MSLDITAKVVANQIVVAMINNRANQGGKQVLVTKSAGADAIKHFLEVWVESILAKVVGVSKIFDVFG